MTALSYVLMAAAAFVNFEIFTATRPRLGSAETTLTGFAKTGSARQTSAFDQGTAAELPDLSERGHRPAGCSERT